MYVAVVELVYTGVLKIPAFGIVGSSPTGDTWKKETYKYATVEQVVCSADCKSVAFGHCRFDSYL